MKKLLLILLCLPMIGFGQVYIPDANFKAYLVGEPSINTNGDTEIQVSEAAAHNGTINCNSMNISDLTGIEDFTALTQLWCLGNLLSSLDVSQNTALNTLNCSDNQLTSLDVSNNTALIYLSCKSNQLSSLDVSNNTALIYLRCQSNQLSSLDVSNNNALTLLFCTDNQLTSLDVSGATALTRLWCQNNTLTSLDVSGFTALDELHCMGNQLTSLEVSGATALTNLWCNDNNLTSLDVSQNSFLIELLCSDNYLTSLNLSTNIVLKKLYCINNHLISLDLRNGNNLNWEWVGSIGSYFVFCQGNPSLYCINVDDATWSTDNLLVASTNIDPQHYFSTNCSPSAVQEHTTTKQLLKVTDLLGRETKGTKNEVLFYIYDDGTVEKRIVIE
jgi:hypothetical protein